MPTQITEKTASRIVDAVERVCDLVDQQGNDPTAAAVKVAREMSLMPGHVDMVCKAYNAALINDQRQGESDFQSKFAAAPQADASQAIAELFPSQGKTALAVDSVSPRYSQPYVPVRQRQSKVASMQDKLAAFEQERQARKQAEAARQWEQLSDYDKAKQELAKVAELKEACRRAESEAHFKVAAMRDAFRQEASPDHLAHNTVPAADFAWLRKVAHRRYGELGVRLVNRLAESELNSLAKQAYEQSAADLRESIIAFDRPIQWDRGTLRAIKTAAEAVEKLAELKAELAVTTLRSRMKASEYYQPASLGKAALASPGGILPPGVTAAGYRQEVLDKACSVLTGFFGGLGSAAGRSGASDPQPPVEEAKLQLGDPLHGAKLRAIRAQQALNHLMDSDDVIAAKSPEEVASAFNELAMATPSLVDNLPIMRAHLRRQLQGNLSPFEAQQLMDAEKKATPIDPATV